MNTNIDLNFPSARPPILPPPSIEAIARECLLQPFADGSVPMPNDTSSFIMPDADMRDLKRAMKNLTQLTAYLDRQRAALGLAAGESDGSAATALAAVKIVKPAPQNRAATQPSQRWVTRRFS